MKDAALLATGTDPLQLVLPLSVAAAWAYSDPPLFDVVMRRRAMATLPARFIEVVNDAMFVTAKAYVVRVGAGVIVTFRGTEPTNLINWLADLTFQKVAFHTKRDAVAPPPHGYVHGGFYRNTRAIWPEVVEALHDFDPAWIYITGHSFGGALAVLAGALLADYATVQKPKYGALWEKVRGIYTFGQPMVGDADFARAYGETVGRKLVRFIYAQDIVPHLPSKTEGWLPVHFGQEYRAPTGTTWELQSQPATVVRNFVGDNLIAALAWAKDQVAFAPDWAFPYSWGDHAPNNYVRVSLPAGAMSGSEFD